MNAREKEELEYELSYEFGRVLGVLCMMALRFAAWLAAACFAGVLFGPLGFIAIAVLWWWRWTRKA